MSVLSSVGVVVPTRGDRRAQLDDALTSILSQDYDGNIQVVVVLDRPEPVGGMRNEEFADDRVEVIRNTRTPGLAGARNSGIMALSTDLIAFCDDDDVWLPGKLSAQIEALAGVPGAEFASCGIVVKFKDISSERLAGTSEIGYRDLTRSRMVMVHSSTYLIDRKSLVNGIGLVDETIPGSQNEDWDLALRAAKRRPIVNVDRAFVEVAWGSGSYYSRQWETKVAALMWMLEHHPDIARDRVAAARVYAQIAFGHAYLRRRGEACQWSMRSARLNILERRIPVVLAVTLGFVSGDRVLHVLHARGHGI